MRSYTLLTRFACALLTTLFTFGAADAQSVYGPNTEYHIGDLVQGSPDVDSTHNVYRCIKEVTKGVGGEPNVDYSHWELNYVAGPASNPVTTILIGTSGAIIGPFPNLQIAWAYVQNARIAQSATLKLVIQASQSLGGSFSLDHPFGANIILEGSSPGIVLSFPAGVHGLTIDTNHALGGLQNLTVGAPSPTQSTSTYGIYASSGASISNISSVNVANFYGDIAAEKGASITATGDVSLSGFSGGGCGATTGASVVFGSGCLTVQSFTTGVAALYASTEGVVRAQGCSIKGAGLSAFALNDGLIDVTNGTLSNTVSGNDNLMEADMHSHIIAENTKLGIGTEVTTVDDNTNPATTTYTVYWQRCYITFGSIIDISGSDAASWLLSWLNKMNVTTFVEPIVDAHFATSNDDSFAGGLVVEESAGFEGPTKDLQ